MLYELDEFGEFAPLVERLADPIYEDSLVDKASQLFVWKLTAKNGYDSDEEAMDTLVRDVREAVGDAATDHIALKPKLCFKGELASLGGSAFSPNSKIMIYISQDETTHIEYREAASLPCTNLWDAERRSLRHQLFGHTDSMIWASTSPYSIPVASITLHCTPRVWDANSGVSLHTLAPFGGKLWSGAFSPCRKYHATSQVGSRCYIHVYDIGTGQTVSQLAKHTWISTRRSCQ